MHDANHLARALCAAGRPDDPLIHLGDAVQTRGEFWEAAARMAAALAEAGAAPGDRVAVQVEKSLEALHLAMGLVLAGAALLPLNTAYTPAEIGYFLDDAEPAVFVCDPSREAALAPVAAQAGVGRVLTLGANGSGSLAEMAAALAPLAEAVPRGPDDLAAILYTSGTTGRSKGAMLTHRNIASNGATLVGTWGMGPSDVLIHALPIFHTHGLFVATNTALISGARMLLHAKFDPDAILADMTREGPARATMMMGVPTFYTRLLDHPGLTREATSGMRLFISGSAPLLAETHARWRDRTGHAILERYGMTETGMLTSNPLDGDRRAGTVGLPLRDVEVIVADPATGAPLPRGETGMIEVRGPNVFKGYWRMPEKTAAELRPSGFFITGDLGRIEPDGYVSIVGRAKDLIISGGYNVYPKEVETLIDALPGVVESAVIGLPHPDFGEGVAAVVVPAPGAALTAEGVVAAVAPQLARYKQPRAVFFADALPRNAMGKVQKAELARRHATAFAPVAQS
ncbi:malonate--CoA ligase [Rubrimonas sp.]|uniref:malonate--CoA ligase n=1 Tax=Rubrimonas sp. TaxID=2036015 RepID=UPI002FDDC668